MRRETRLTQSLIGIATPRLLPGRTASRYKPFGFLAGRLFRDRLEGHRAACHRSGLAQGGGRTGQTSEMVRNRPKPRRRARLGRMRGVRCQSVSRDGGHARPRQQMYLPVAKVSLQTRTRPALAGRRSRYRLPIGRHAKLGHRVVRSSPPERRCTQKWCTLNRGAHRPQGRARGPTRRTASPRGPKGRGTA